MAEMTPQQAVEAAVEETAKVLNAVAVASRTNGKPVLNAQGQPINLRPPAIGDLLVRALNNQQILLQLAGLNLRLLAGGFTLSDHEAARVADLVVVRLKGIDETRRQELVQETEQKAPATDQGSRP